MKTNAKLRPSWNFIAKKLQCTPAQCKARWSEILSLQNGGHTDAPPADRIDSGSLLETPAPPSPATHPLASIPSVDQSHADDPPPVPEHTTMTTSATPSLAPPTYVEPPHPGEPEVLTMPSTPSTTSAQNPCFLSAPAPDAPTRLIFTCLTILILNACFSRGKEHLRDQPTFSPTAPSDSLPCPILPQPSRHVANYVRDVAVPCGFARPCWEVYVCAAPCH